MRLLLTTVAIIVALFGWLIIRRHVDIVAERNAGIKGAPQLEVGDTLPRPDGKTWPLNRGRSIVIVGSATCGACSANQPFEQAVVLKAHSLGLPVFFLLSSRGAQDSLANRLMAEGKAVLRADLAAIGVIRTPTILSVDSAGRILAIRIGTVGSKDEELYATELLRGTSAPLYSRIANAELPQYIARSPDYQIIELRDVSTPLPKGFRYRQIPIAELTVRAAHEIANDATVFVDCNTVISAMACQNALLILSQSRKPDHLVAVNLPTRREAEGNR